MTPAPHKPAKRAPAVIRSGEVYNLAERYGVGNGQGGGADG